MIAKEAHSAELAIIISYPTSTSGIIVLLKTPPKYRKLDYNKNERPQKNHAYACQFCRSWYNGSYTIICLDNENSRIALSNDPVFNNTHYIDTHISLLFFSYHFT